MLDLQSLYCSCTKITSLEIDWYLYASGWYKTSYWWRCGSAVQCIYPAGWLEWNFGNTADTEPDSNMIDVGLFNGLKAKTDGIKGDGRNIDTCIQRMVRLFAEYDATAIEIVWGVMFDIYRLILLHNGNNDFKLPNSGVRARGRVNGNFVIWQVNPA